MIHRVDGELASRDQEILAQELRVAQFGQVGAVAGGRRHGELHVCWERGAGGSIDRIAPVGFCHEPTGSRRATGPLSLC